jgi:hypothetical protein
MGTRGSFPGVKRSGREADPSLPSSAEVKEWVELYLNFPNTPSWRGAQLKKHSDYFCFTFTVLLIRPEREADYSAPFSAEIKNKWSYTFTLPTRHDGAVLC